MTGLLQEAKAKIEGGLRIKDAGEHSKQCTPNISLITVVFNGAATLEDTIRSVVGQTYGNVEYLIIDGGSTDSTLDVLRRYEGKIDYWASEKDVGIYDAMNKGIALSSGEIIGFINADDFYAKPEVLARVAEVFADPDIDACYGDLCYVRQADSSVVVRYWKSSEFSPTTFEKGWCPPHPTFFVRRAIYERCGKFDLSYKIAADVELMMRFLEKYRIRSRYIPEVLVEMRMGGTTNQSLSNILKQNREILRALAQHKLRSSMLRLFGSKMVSRGMQFFARPVRKCGSSCFNAK